MVQPYEAAGAHFSERLGRALDLWKPTSGACFAFWSDACPAETTLKLDDSFWQDYPGSLSLRPEGRTGTIKNRDFLIHQSGSRSISLEKCEGDLHGTCAGQGGRGDGRRQRVG